MSRGSTPFLLVCSLEVELIGLVSLFMLCQGINMQLSKVSRVGLLRFGSGCEWKARDNAVNVSLRRLARLRLNLRMCECVARGAAE